jgi:MFS family permease
MTLIPLLWLVSEDFSWLIFAQVYSGFAWAGFEIASFSFFFDLTTHKNRTTSIAYYNVVNGFMLISGAIVGAWLLSINTPWSTYFTIFVASAVLRFLSVALFLRRVREPRSVKSVGYRSLLFRELMYKPVRYTTLNIMSHIHTKVIPSTILPVQNVLSQTKNVADSLMQPFEQTLGSAQNKIKSNIKTYKRKF